MQIAIIGANRGIGLEFCRQLCTNHQVHAFCRTSSPELDTLANQTNLSIHAGCDVADQNTLNQAALRANTTFDWLIHVSGILSSQSMDNLDFKAIEKQFLINSLGPLKTVTAFLPWLKNGSKIGLLTSRMGSVTDNTSGGQYGYRMSKSALNIAGVSLAHDLKKESITVLLLHPGYVRTEMTNGSGLIDAQESVAGLLEIIQHKGLAETGSFWHTNGEQLPW